MKARSLLVENKAQSQPRAICVGDMVATAWTHNWPWVALGQSKWPRPIERASSCLSARVMKRPSTYATVVRLSTSSTRVLLHAKVLETGAKTDSCEACVDSLFARRELLAKAPVIPWGIVCASRP